MKKIFTIIMLATFAATMYAQTAKNLQASAESSSLETMPSAAKSYSKVNVENRVTTLEGEVKTLKGQVETQNGQIASLQSRLNELADRNAEYKKALDIKQTLNATDADGYQYGFVSAIGDKATGKLTITLNLFNHGESREKQFKHAQFSDYEGNAYETYSYQFGNMDIAKPTIDSNSNIKLKFIFDNVSVDTKRISTLTIQAYSSTWGNSDMSFNFRDLPVKWK